MTSLPSAAKTGQSRPDAAAPALISLWSMTTGLSASAIVLLALAAVAFWPQYLSKFARAHPYTHVHALSGTLWLGVLIVQPLLIRARKFRAHRSLGRLACVIGAAFLLSGFLLAHKAAVAMSEEEFVQAGFSLYLPITMAVIFAASVCMGVAWRRVPAVHARFMASSALPLLDPVFSRILASYLPPLPALPLYQIPAFTLAAVIVWAFWRTLPVGMPGRRAFRNFAVFVTLALMAFFGTPYSDIWISMVAWLRSI